MPHMKDGVTFAEYGQDQLVRSGQATLAFKTIHKLSSAEGLA